MLADTLENALAYPLGDAWKTIIAALAELAAKNPDPGEYPLPQGAKAVVSLYTTKPPLEGRYENHRIMADIQILLAGEEFIDVVSSSGLTPEAPYDAAKDITFFAEKPAAACRVRLKPGIFVLLMPQDAHMPYIRVGEPETAKKAVVKLPASLLRPA